MSQLIHSLIQPVLVSTYCVSSITIGIEDTKGKTKTWQNTCHPGDYVLVSMFLKGLCKQLGTIKIKYYYVVETEIIYP